MAAGSEVSRTRGAQLTLAERSLADFAGDAARDEALGLLAALLHEPMGQTLAQLATPMDPRAVETYSAWISRRQAGEAIAHITGRLPFMGLELAVERDSPLVSDAAQRLVEVALECARSGVRGDLCAAELGAGCGAIALALAAFEPRFSRIYAVDSSAEALRVAAANGVRYQLNLVIDWRQGDGLGAVPEPVDMIICDSLASVSPPEVTRLLAEAPAKLRPGGALLCALADEAEALASLAAALPDARLWRTPAFDGACTAVAQRQ